MFIPRFGKSEFSTGDRGAGRAAKAPRFRRFRQSNRLWGYDLCLGWEVWVVSSFTVLVAMVCLGWCSLVWVWLTLRRWFGIHGFFLPKTKRVSSHQEDEQIYAQTPIMIVQVPCDPGCLGLFRVSQFFFDLTRCFLFHWKQQLFPVRPSRGLSKGGCGSTKLRMTHPCWPVWRPHR